MSQALSQYVWQDVLTAAQDSFSRDISDFMGPTICTMAQAEIWSTFDWPQTLAELPRFTLSSQFQDYGAPMGAVPADFFGLRSAYLVDLSFAGGGAVAWRRPLEVMSQLPETRRQGLPAVISYNESNRCFRLHPRFTQSGTPLWCVGGTYKKLPPAKMTSSTVHTTKLPFPDVFFSACVAAVKWAAMELNDEPQAGAVQVQGQSIGYTGQYGKMMAALKNAARKAGMERGPAPMHPDLPLQHTYYREFYPGAWR